MAEPAADDLVMSRARYGPKPAETLILLAQRDHYAREASRAVQEAADLRLALDVGHSVREALEARVAELEEALAPFAAAWRNDMDGPDFGAVAKGDWLRAHATYHAGEGGEGE